MFTLRSLHCFSKESSSQAHFLSHASCSWLDRTPFPLPHSNPSLFDPRNWSFPCHPRQGLAFGRFAEQSALTGYEPNDPVEVCSTEVTTVLLPFEKGKHWFDLQLWRGHHHYSLLRRKWMKDQKCWRHHCQHRRETNAAPFKIYHTFLPARTDPWRCTHTSQAEIHMFCKSLMQRAWRNP